MIASQMADIDPGQIADGVAVSSSELTEVGVKGSFLNDQLFFQANYYEQERLNVNTQDVVTNQVSLGEGVEVEVRYLVSDALTLTLAYSEQEVSNLTTLDNGWNYSFFGIDDMPHIDPALHLGGQPGGFIRSAEVNPKAIRAGIPLSLIHISEPTRPY